MSEVKGVLETVEPYQFEPVASDSSAETDTKAEDDNISSLSMEETEQDRLRSPELLLLSLNVADCPLFNSRCKHSTFLF